MMQFEQLGADGLIMAHYNAFGDARGFFKRVFCKDECTPVLNGRDIVQINISSNATIGTIRGMHLQKPPHSEMKFVQCVKGAVRDVVVDVRKGSKTFMQHFAFDLRDDDHKALIIPEGFAHGFQVLEADSHLLYFHTAAYAPDAGMTINPMDPKVGIDWPLPLSVISDKDKNTPFLTNEFEGLDG